MVLEVEASLGSAGAERMQSVGSPTEVLRQPGLAGRVASLSSKGFTSPGPASWWSGPVLEARFMVTVQTVSVLLSLPITGRLVGTEALF